MARSKAKPKEVKAPTHACGRCDGKGVGKKARGNSIQRPDGWKDHGGRLLCKKCVGECFCLRAMELPVVGIADGGTWEQFGPALRDAFRCSTGLANWAVRQLLTNDVVRLPGMTALPAMPSIELYKLYNEQGCPLGNVAAQTRAAIFQAVQNDYRSRRRLPCLWTGEEGLPLKRYPAPFPVRNQSWSAEWQTIDGRPQPCVSLRLHGMEELGPFQPPRWILKLASGRPFARQLRDFKAIVDGATINGQIDLYERPCGQTDRNCATSATKRGAGGSARQPRRLLVKFVAYFPRPEKAPASGVMSVRTDPEAFWVAEHMGRVVRPWILNGEEMLRWTDEMRFLHQSHAVWLQRMREDAKVERRTHIGSRKQAEDAFEKRCNKHHRRVKTWIDQACAQIVNYCLRQRIAAVLYDDTDRSWCQAFPWYSLCSTLRSKLEAKQIVPGGNLVANVGESEGSETVLAG